MEKIILITGSTSGIGKAIAKQQVEIGNKVIVNSNKDVDDNFFQKEFGQSNNVFFKKADISNENYLRELRDWIEEQFGRLDSLVVNAGIMPLPCGIDDITVENIDKTINVNLEGSFWSFKLLGNLI